MTSTPQTFDPSSMRVSVTPAARVHLQRMLDAEAASAVRLGVTESGCNGYMYDLSFAAEVADDDVTFDLPDGLLVVVRQADLPLVQGTEVDYVTEGLNSALKFKNPNAETHCGCGESFSIAQPEQS